MEETLKEILSVVSSHAEAGSSAEMPVLMNNLQAKVDKILQMLQGDKLEQKKESGSECTHSIQFKD